MRLVSTFLVLVFSINGLIPFQYVEAHTDFQRIEEAVEGHKNYLNHWVIEVPGGKDIAERIAAQHGFHVERQFLTIPDHYLLTHNAVAHRSKRSATHHTKRLANDSRITFAEQQHEKLRVKRGNLYNRDLAGSLARSSGELNDPEYSNQWYLDDHHKSVSDGVFDMGVKEAWKYGVSGKGVSVTILDDGLEKTHPDLAPNYDPKASYDFNDHDPDPTPRYEETNENKHGTRCGGEIAMVANNGNCGVGIAFNVRIGGVRMLDGKVTDRVEAESIGFTINVDISSASWGPNDDGKTLEMPGKVAMKGIRESIEKGRDGKGTILVWAAGNGGHVGDNCNCDGYTSDHRTLSVSSASQHGHSPWYSEKCSSTMAATYSSGNHNEGMVITADLRGTCTKRHSGTSAAAPMAAGILALVLEKNPTLTWRDVQHLVVITSRYTPLMKEKGWYQNGVGLCVNHAFGFGLMDAENLVKQASEWKAVGEQRICRVQADTDSFTKTLTSGNNIEVNIVTDGCHGQDQEVNFLEHIKLVLTLEYSKRGNVYVELESPSGTITPLMLERGLDKSERGFVRWPLMSVHTWAENPSGNWTLRVADRQENGKEGGQLKDVELMLFGTKEKPFYHERLGEDNKCGHLAQSPEERDEIQIQAESIVTIKTDHVLAGYIQIQQS